MKVKTFARIGAAMELAISGAGLYYMRNLFADPVLLNTISYGSLEQKIGAGVMYSLGTATIALCAVPLIDGMADMTLGTHHYIPTRLWHDRTKSEKTKNETNRYISTMLNHRNDEIPSFSELRPMKK